MPALCGHNFMIMKKLAILLIVFAFFSCEKSGPNPEPQATCSDGILNGDEISIDCGGSCNACEEPGGEITSYDGMTLVWNDEFDYEGAPSAAKWHLQTLPIFGGGWANNEQQHYTDRQTNATVSDGTLKIIAKKESYTFEDSTKEYTSARLNSKYDFKYGRVDVRAKLPSQAGAWPAIWTLGSNINERGGVFQATKGEVSWPECGEIDIMEKRGWQTDRVLGTFHWKDDSSGNPASYGLDKSIDGIGSEFHLYSLIWEDGVLQIYVDNERVVQIGNNQTEFKNPHYLLLNVAMGGTLGGDIPSSFSQATMEIDYVRVYQAQ
jgi:beta-glucanase (GH16 family)